MKYDPRKAFPYPVLPDDRDYNDDYVNSDFQVPLDLVAGAGSGDIVLTANFQINENAILERIGKDAAYAVHVLCAQTCFRRLVRTHETRLEYVFKNRELHGKAVLTGCVVCTAGVRNYHSPNFHSEFGGKSFNLSRGSVLAVAVPEVFYVDAEPAKPVAAVIQLVKNGKIPKGEFDYDIDDDLVRILMRDKDYNRFNAGRRHADTVKFLIMSVYYPVLTEVLRAMYTEGGEVHDGKRWYRAIERKIGELGMEPKEGNFHLVAQRLLGRPLGYLPLMEEGE
ncbi:MAG: hypothetical protein ACR2QC_03160 [Gammaproteobacteria bacterium]